MKPRMTDDSRLIEILVEEGGDRLDRFLAERIDLSRSRLEQLIESGSVTVNGSIEKKRYKPAAGDTIRVEVPEPRPAEAAPEDIPLEVVFEDDHLAVINKQAGLVVHPAPGNWTGTLVNGLLHHLEGLSGIGGVMRPGIVHRLDRDTSGLMIVAKSDIAHRKLSAALKRREVSRKYLAASWGHLNEDRISVDAPIARDPGDRKRMGVVEGGRRAVTHFEVLERWTVADLVRAELETGRTHQIRVHLAHVGHPVVGDDVYANRREKGFSGPSRLNARELSNRVSRQFLHAAELAFKHPVSEEELAFRADLPGDLRSAADWARAEVRK